MNSHVKNGLFMCFAFVIYCEVPQKLTLEKTYKSVVNSQFIKALCNRELNLLEVYIEFF